MHRTSYEAQQRKFTNFNVFFPCTNLFFFWPGETIRFVMQIAYYIFPYVPGCKSMALFCSLTLYLLINITYTYYIR